MMELVLSFLIALFLFSVFGSLIFFVFYAVLLVLMLLGMLVGKAIDTFVNFWTSDE